MLIKIYCDSNYNNNNFKFIPSNTMLLQYMLWSCVRPSQARIVPEWLNIGSHEQPAQ